jgi:hypothetical protein
MPFSHGCGIAHSKMNLIDDGRIPGDSAPQRDTLFPVAALSFSTPFPQMRTAI